MARKKTTKEIPANLEIVTEQLHEENIKTDKFSQAPPEVEVIPDKVSEILRAIDGTLVEKSPEESKKFVALKFRMWHPFQNKYIGDIPVELEMDGWLKSQIMVDLVREI